MTYTKQTWENFPSTTTPITAGRLSHIEDGIYDVSVQIDTLLTGAPAALDTLNELAAALNDDANFASTVTNALNLKAPLASPVLTGTPEAPTAAVDTSTTQVATTAFVVGQGYLKSATASSTYAPIASPTFTGVPSAPTATGGTNTTQIATTAFVVSEVSSKAPIASPTFTGTVSSEGTILKLNSDATSGTDDAYLTIERGSDSDVSIRWNETTDAWEYTNDGTTYQAMGSGTGGLTVSTTAPVGPSEGDMWFDSNTGSTYVYYDSAWVEVGVGSQSSRGTRWTFTASGGELSVSGLSGGSTLAYEVANENVYLNGALLVRGSDYTAVNGTSVAFTSALTSGDVVEVLSFESLPLVDTYSRAEIDEKLSEGGLNPLFLIGA